MCRFVPFDVCISIVIAAKTSTSFRALHPLKESSKSDVIHTTV